MSRLRPLLTVSHTPVYQEAGTRRVWWTSGAAIDADGANGQTIIKGVPQFAYRPDNKGLDLLANAGYPKNPSAYTDILVCDDKARPLEIEINGQMGFCSMTAYSYRDRERRLHERWLDSISLAYIVVNPLVRLKARGVVLGCKARVTYRGKAIDAVVGDVSGARTIGELSYAAAVKLKFPNCSPRTGGVDGGVLFELFPNVPAEVDGEHFELKPA